MFVKCVKSGVQISWKTETEKNFESFFIERSEDGELFKTIATIKAAGNINKSLSYNYFDEDGPGDSYYRLREKDFDGREIITSLMKVWCPLAEEQ